MAEWLKAHAWKACIGQKPIEGSNPSLSAIWCRSDPKTWVTLCTGHIGNSITHSHHLKRLDQKDWPKVQIFYHQYQNILDHNP